MNGYEVVDAGHHGSGKEEVRTEWKTIRTTFHNFASLPAERGAVVSSPTLECHGLKWKVNIYPGGNISSTQVPTFVSAYLVCESSKEAGKDVKASFNIRSPSSGVTICGTGNTPSATFGTSSTASLGIGDGVPRAVVLNPMSRFLFNGSMAIDVDIQVVLDNFPWGAMNTSSGNVEAGAVAEVAGLKRDLEDAVNLLQVGSNSYNKLREEYRKIEPLSLDMLQLFESDDDADVTFEVGGDAELAGKEKKIFRAHRLILSARCPTLALLAEDCDPKSPIPIVDLEPDMFRKLLRFIYGGEIPTKKVLKKDARAIIRSADRFGCTGLKLAAEAELASGGISSENAAELILFADGTNCALLKEAAMDAFAADVEGVMASDGYELVKESPAIMGEMMAAMANASKKRPASDGDDKNYKRMRVAVLRKKLDAKGLDIDGSKEMLVSRLDREESGVIEVE